MDFFLYFCSQIRQPPYRRQRKLKEESPGSRESPYFLTGRGAPRKRRATDSATEKIPLESTGRPATASKGENARQELTTGTAMYLMANLMG